MSATVDEGIIVLFGLEESYIENTSTGQRIRMNRRQGVFVVQLDGQAGSRATKHVRFDEPNMNERTPVPRRPV